MARRKGQQVLFREQAPALTCRELFPDQRHCAHCHDPAGILSVLTSQRGQEVGCCCRAAALMLAANLAEGMPPRLCEAG